MSKLLTSEILLHGFAPHIIRVAELLKVGLNHFFATLSG
jgi:hypothetical protein